jgi:hypothetical protein
MIGLREMHRKSYPHKLWKCGSLVSTTLVSFCTSVQLGPSPSHSILLIVGRFRPRLAGGKSILQFKNLWERWFRIHARFYTVPLNKAPTDR